MQRVFTYLILFFSLLASPVARAGAHAFESEIEKFEAADRAQMPPKGAVLFVGSSSIRFWTNVAECFPKKKIIARGFGGSTMADALYFADRIILPYQAKQILVYEGDNDLAAGKSPETVFGEFKTLVEKIHAASPKTKIWFISVKPSPSRAKIESQARALNADIELWSKTQKRVGYIDVWNPMLGPDGKPRPDIFRPDNLHMNAAGYEIWTKIISKKI
jgi:lysophospholipase L1-like esterase